MLRVAVVGGGPSGSCAAEILAKAGIETWLFERIEAVQSQKRPCFYIRPEAVVLVSMGSS